jgi:hypothetical protein
MHRLYLPTLVRASQTSRSSEQSQLPPRLKEKIIDRNEDVKSNLPFLSYPLASDHPLHEFWPVLRKRIMADLAENQLEWWLIDVCHQRLPGYQSHQPSQAFHHSVEPVSPEPVVIFIQAPRLDVGTSTKLKKVVEVIVETSNVPERCGKIYVELSDNRIRPQACWMGSGIGGANDATLSGTLGA